MNKVNNVALLAGATGLVGREILRLLESDDTIAEVRALVRRPLSQKIDSKVRQHIADFNKLQDHPDWFRVDIVFSALGTTIHQARTKEAFRRVDYEYALTIAKLAREAGAGHFLFVSALAANPRSLFFYNRVKGELEQAILALGYPAVTIARPSLLLGDRSPKRLGEELIKPFARLVPSQWAPVRASQVASALVQAARKNSPGVCILDNNQLRRS